MTKDRGPRAPGVQKIIQNSMMVETMMALGGGIGHAEDDPNPRPLPPWSMADSRRRSERAIIPAVLEKTWQASDALYLTFASDRYDWEPRDTITVPRDDLWWLADRGDTIVLSDRVYHHCTGIGGVDRAGDRISFLDPWPERFFLRRGLNAAGVEAEEKPLSISRAEFNRVVVGITTLDTPDLLKRYLDSHPAQWNNPELLTRLGLALLDAEREGFCRLAAPYFKRAVGLTSAEGNGGVAELAPSYLYLSLVIASYVERRAADPLALKPFLDDLHALESGCSRARFFEQLSPDDLARIGSAAASAKDWDEALAFFDAASVKDPEHEQAHFLRAAVKLQQGDCAGTIQDARRTLSLNEASIKAAKLARDGKDPRDRIGIGEEQAQIEMLTRRRLEVLAMRASALRQSGEYAAAHADIDSIFMLDPSYAPGHAQRAAIHESEGRLQEARAEMAQAIALEQDDGKRAAYQALAEAIGQTAQATAGDGK